MLVNEVNTMPGFTPMSHVPAVVGRSGLDYPTLIDRLLTHRDAAGRPACADHVQGVIEVVL